MHYNLYDEKDTFFLVLVLESLVGLEVVNFSFFGISGWGIDLDDWELIEVASE